VKKSPKQPERTPEEQKQFLADLMFTKHLSMSWRVVLCTVLPLLLLGSLGYALDHWLGTGKIFFILSLVLSFVVAQVLNYAVFTRLTRHSSK